MTAVTHATRSIRRPASVGALAAFVRLEVRRALRNRRYVMFAVAFPVVFYALYTGVLSGTSADATALVGGIRGGRTSWCRWQPTAPSARRWAVRS